MLHPTKTLITTQNLGFIELGVLDLVRHDVHDYNPYLPSDATRGVDTAHTMLLLAGRKFSYPRGYPRLIYNKMLQSVSSAHSEIWIYCCAAQNTSVGVLQHLLFAHTTLTTSYRPTIVRPSICY